MVPPNISSLRTAEYNIDMKKKCKYKLDLLTDAQWTIFDVKICEGILTIPPGEDDYVNIDVIELVNEITGLVVVNVFDILNAIEFRYTDSFIICRAGKRSNDFDFKLKPVIQYSGITY